MFRTLRSPSWKRAPSLGIRPSAPEQTRSGPRCSFASDQRTSACEKQEIRSRIAVFRSSKAAGRPVRGAGGCARYALRLWWPHETKPLVLATACPCSLLKPSVWWSAAAMAGVHSARSSEQRRGLSRAARPLECARGTDKALGESQLSRPLTRATATPSTRMCALHVCRHPCTSALARMLTRRCCASLGRLWDHSKDSCMSLVHPFAHSHIN